jgi:hypothetical protein
MPFTVKDVEKHTKKATTPKLKRQWVEVANGKLDDCDAGDAECEAAAIKMANGVVAKAVAEADVAEATMKTVGGKQYPAGDFLVVEDPESPDTWHLQVKKNGKVDRRLMGGAKAALTAPGGHRGKKYAGPNKAQAISKLKALYKSEDMEWGEAEVGEYYGDMPEPYMATGSPTTFADLIAKRDADEAADKIRQLAWDYSYLIDEVIKSPDIDDKVSAFRSLGTEFLSLAGDILGGGGAEEAQSIQDYGPAVAVARDATEADLAEVQATFDSGRRAPVVIDFQVLKPGPGNRRDNHYYLPETVKRDIHVFEGADVFATDHKEKERSERTKVGKVLSVPTRFTAEGAAVGEVLIYDPDQAEKARNRADAGALGTLECSIYGRGRQKKGEIDGNEYRIVEAITQGLYLELVSKAGAGGMALSLSESATGDGHMKENEKPEEETPVEETTFSEAEEETPAAEEETTQEQEAQPLAELDALKALSASSLPRQSRERLAKLEWKDAGALAEAIKAEAEYVKSLTQSGQPANLGASEAQDKQPLTEADRVRRFNTIMAEVGGTQVPVPAE